MAGNLPRKKDSIEKEEKKRGRETEGEKERKVCREEGMKSLNQFHL